VNWNPSISVSLDTVLLAEPKEVRNWFIVKVTVEVNEKGSSVLGTTLMVLRDAKAQQCSFNIMHQATRTRSTLDELVVNLIKLMSNKFRHRKVVPPKYLIISHQITVGL